MPVDPKRRREVLDTVHRLGGSGAALPLELFFEGNDDEGSIGCNLMPHPGVEFFYLTLQAIRNREEVQDVLVQIYEVMEEDEDSWPYSETVLIYTSASRDHVASWVRGLHADEVYDRPSTDRFPPGAPSPSPGVRVYTVWWD